MLAAVRAARGLAPGLPVAGLGASFGAAWLTCALSQEWHGLSAAVMECPFTTLDEYWVRCKVAYAVLKASNVLMPRLLAKLRPVARARGIHGVKAVLFIYVVDMKEFPRMNAVYERVFAGHRPARTTVQVSALPDPGLRVEIDCIAYVP